MSPHAFVSFHFKFFIAKKLSMKINWSRDDLSISRSVMNILYKAISILETFYETSHITSHSSLGTNIILFLFWNCLFTYPSNTPIHNLCLHQHIDDHVYFWENRTKNIISFACILFGGDDWNVWVHK